MPQPRRFCLVLLIALSGLFLETETVSKSGCQGDSLELYHIAFDYKFTLVYFYKGNALIDMWTMQNSFLNTTLSNGYSNKIFLDIDGNVHIRKLHISDEAKYTIKIENRNGSYDYEVQLFVLVAPTTKCRPKIKRVDDVLTVHLEAQDCGRPVPSVHWLFQSGAFLEDTKAIKLPPGRQTGTYYACIEGEVLICAKSSKISDYCSFHIVDEENPSTGQEGAGNYTVQGIDRTQSPRTKDIFLTIATCSSLICIAVIMYVIYPFVTWKKNVMRNSRNQDLVHNDRTSLGQRNKECVPMLTEEERRDENRLPY